MQTNPRVSIFVRALLLQMAMVATLARAVAGATVVIHVGTGAERAVPKQFDRGKIRSARRLGAG